MIMTRFTFNYKTRLIQHTTRLLQTVNRRGTNLSSNGHQRVFSFRSRSPFRSLRDQTATLGLEGTSGVKNILSSPSLPPRYADSRQLMK